MQAAVIINPVAGKPVDILRILTDFFSAYSIDWEPYITQHEGHAAELLGEALTQDPDVIVVYGGDGTVMEVARELIGSAIPLLVIPGGTANVVAKEFGIPQNIEQALEVLNSGQEVSVDTFDSAQKLGFIRVNHGIFANAIITAKREQKELLGVLAYTAESLKQVFNTVKTNYRMIIDGQHIETEGIGASVTNLASVGLSSLKFHEKIQPHDGLLDVIIVKNIASGIEHYQGKHVSIELPDKQQIIVDDTIEETDTIDSTISKKQLQMLVPPEYTYVSANKN